MSALSDNLDGKNAHHSFKIKICKIKWRIVGPISSGEKYNGFRYLRITTCREIATSNNYSLQHKDFSLRSSRTTLHASFIRYVWLKKMISHIKTERTQDNISLPLKQTPTLKRLKADKAASLLRMFFRNK